MYSDRQLATARTVVLAVWILSGLTFFPPLRSLSIAGLGQAVFGILFCVHLVEFAFFRKVYADAGGSLFGHFLRHMVYGVIYKSEVEQRGGAAS
jgi:hypothetical protein